MSRKTESEMADTADHEVLGTWTARRMHPIVLLWVFLVFLGFGLIAHFVLHSPAGVKALALAAIGAIGPLVPNMLQRVEYRLTTQKLEKRARTPDGDKPFDLVFEVQHLDHIVRGRRGLKYELPIDDAGFRRFWKRHLSDRYSGEVHVEKPDLAEVISQFDRLGVHIR